MGNSAGIASQEPDGAPRIASLDILRGIAILGILFMNIETMGGTLAAAHGALPSLNGWTVPDQIAWWLRQVFALGTARAMLEMLFGAGMVILTGRLAEGRATWGVVRRYYWRMGVLLAFGLIHVWILLWQGDILHIYALSAMIAYPLSRLSGRWLIALGCTASLYGVAMGSPQIHHIVRDNALYPAAIADRAAGKPLTKAQKAAIKSTQEWHQAQRAMRADDRKELVERGSGYAAWAKAMRDEWLKHYTGGWRGLLRVYWEAIATILLGAGLFKLGILSGRRSRRFYLRLMIGGYAVGLPIRIVAALVSARMDDSVTYAWPLSEASRLATTIGHLGLVYILLTSPVGQRLLRPFVAAGRTALSIYVLQTILCLWVIYPPFAFGLFGTQGWLGLMLTAAAVDVALLLLANWWVREFSIAPVEWAWRSLASGQVLPFGRARPAIPAIGPLPA